MTAKKLILAVLLFTACGYRSREQVVTAADLRAPERTRITNYMSAPLRFGSPSEQAPAAVSRAVLADEARIARVEGDQVCFDVVLRSAVDLDTPLSEMRLLVDEQAARVGDEVVTVRDYPYSGERDVLVAEHVSGNAFGSLRLTEPVQNVFRVIERRAQVCRTRAAPGPGELALEMIVVQDDNRGNWGEKFVWMVE